MRPVTLAPPVDRLTLLLAAHIWMATPGIDAAEDWCQRLYAVVRTVHERVRRLQQAARIARGPWWPGRGTGRRLYSVCQDGCGVFRFASATARHAAEAKDNYCAGCPVCDGQLCSCDSCLLESEREPVRSVAA